MGIGSSPIVGIRASGRAVKAVDCKSTRKLSLVRIQPCSYGK